MKIHSLKGSSYIQHAGLVVAALVAGAMLAMDPASVQAQELPPIVQAVPQQAIQPYDCPPEALNEQKEKQAKLAKQVAGAYKPVFFDNDFSYICDADYFGYHLGDNLKKRALPGGGSYDIGGQFRLRGQFEQNMRGLGLTGVDDQFLLNRTRVFGDFRFSPDIRVYAEMLDANSSFEDFGPRPIEVNRTEVQNLFVDARLIDNSTYGKVTARVGRQELLLGSQRTVSPLDWANTRRTFEGARLMWKQGDMLTNAFWTNPVRIDDSSFDSPDRDQEFMGIHRAYTGYENQTIETYTYRYLNGRGNNNYKYNTTGIRWEGSRGNLLWDAEAAYQFGDNTDGTDHNAGMATFGLGRKIAHPWKPTLWAFYDYASGDDATGAGNGFDHLFPLAHGYNGFMDLFGRRNLEDVNLRLTMQPTNRLKLIAWYHYMFLETKSDTPYSIAMTPFNAANAPGSADLGHEIDFVASYSLTPRSNLLLGYSHFFSGDYYDSTPGVPFNGDASFFYSQFTVNF